MSAQPSIHVRDNGDGTMTARAMYEPEGVPFTFAASNYLTAAQRYLASRWPDADFRKIGWSANATEAIYHFAEVAPSKIAGMDPVAAEIFAPIFKSFGGQP